MQQNEEEAIKLFKMSAEQVITGFKFLLDMLDLTQEDSKRPQISLKLQIRSIKG